MANFWRVREADAISDYWNAVTDGYARSDRAPANDIDSTLLDTIAWIRESRQRHVPDPDFVDHLERKIMETAERRSGAPHRETAIHAFPADSVPTWIPFPRRWSLAAVATVGLIAVTLAIFLLSARKSENPASVPGTPEPPMATAPAAQTPTAAASAEGKMLWAAASREGVQASALSVPVAVAIGPEGSVYVVDAGTNSIQVYGADGTLLGPWKNAGTSAPVTSGDHALNLHDGDFYLGGIGFDADGNAYLFDSLNDRILKFAIDGTFLLEWGGGGQANGQFSLPVGAVDAENGLVYVADYGNNRVQVFDLDGNFIDKWGSEGRKDGQFNHPSAIAIGRDGSVYVGEDEGGRIQHFDRNGRFLGRIGESALGHISGLAIDANGNLLASAGPEGMIWVFARDGATSVQITQIPGLDSLRFPTGIAIASDGSVLMAIAPPDLIRTNQTTGDLIRVSLPDLP